MVRKPSYLALLIFLLVYFNLSSVFAQETKEELKTKLGDLRQKKFEMTNEYEENLHKIKMEAEERLSKVKADFRKAREECLDDQHKKCEQLRKDFETKLKPMLKKEEELVELVGRDAREDFVKIRTKEMKPK